MAEWLKATDCKSVPERVRWFESTPAQVLKRLRKGSFFVAGMILTTVVVLPSIASIVIRRLYMLSTENVTFSHLFLLRNGVLTPAQLLKRGWTLVLTSFFIDFGRWMRTTQGEALSVVRARSEQSAEDFCEMNVIH